MRKNGFTLIELLAVIVILAIIALIATPIVLSIIDNTKQSSMLRSAEMYLKGVETSVATAIIHEKNVTDGEHPITPTGDVCLGTLQGTGKTATCNGETIEVQMNGEKPTSGTVKIASGKITDIAFTYLNGKTIVKNAGKLAFAEDVEDTPGTTENTLATICTHVSGTEKTAGAKYTCEVKEGTSYTFYVLTTPQEGDTTINLIMDRNIYYDATAGTGSVADATNKGLVAWQTSVNNADGPVTAMDYLYNATKDWTNIPNIEMNYTDEGNTGDNGYGTIVTTDNITKITKKDGTAVTVLTNQEGYSNLKARLPYKSEVSAYDSTNKANAYLYDYLNLYNNIQTNAISRIYGYWTLSSYADRSGDAWDVVYSGRVSGGSVDDGSDYGVRPVINVKL